MGLLSVPHFRPHQLHSDLFAIVLVLDIQDLDTYPESNFAMFVIQSFQTISNKLNDMPNGGELLTKGAQMYEQSSSAVYAQFFFAVPKLGDFDASEMAIGGGALVGTTSMEETRSLAEELEQRIQSDSDTRNLLSNPTLPAFVRAIHLSRGTYLVYDRLRWKFFPAILFSSLFHFPTIKEAVEMLEPTGVGQEKKESNMGCFAAQVCIYDPPEGERKLLRGHADLMMFLDEPRNIERLRQTLHDDKKRAVNDTRTPQRIIPLPHDDEF